MRLEREGLEFGVVMWHSEMQTLLFAVYMFWYNKYETHSCDN